MAIEMMIRPVGCNEALSTIRLSSTFMEVVARAMELNPELRTTPNPFEVEAFGMEKPISAHDFCDKIALMLETIENNKEIAVVYSLVDEWSIKNFGPKAAKGGARGISGLMDGKPFMMDAGVGYCILYPNKDGVRDDEIVDIRNMEFIDTKSEFGKVYIRKSRPKKLAEVAEFTEAVRKIKEDRYENLEIVIC